MFSYNGTYNICTVWYVLFAVHFHSVLILLSADVTAQGLLRSQHKYTNIERVFLSPDFSP